MKRRTRAIVSKCWRYLTLVVVAAAPVALADSSSAEDGRCPATTAVEARSLGDRLRDYGFLQAAGHCYEAAGEYERANRAFLEAAQPQSEVAARQLREQRNEARTLLRKLQQAFQSGR